MTKREIKILKTLLNFLGLVILFATWEAIEVFRAFCDLNTGIFLTIPYVVGGISVYYISDNLEKIIGVKNP